MNSSVWTRQVLEGLKAFIQKVVVLDKNGTPTPIPVKVKKPDEDFKSEAYPMVYLSTISISKRDSTRYFPFKVARNKNPDTNNCVMERSAVPHTIYVQIDFYTTLQDDMDKIIMMWDFEASKDINLPVIDTGGTERTTLALNTGNVLNRVDRLSGNNRVFCTSYTYGVWAEIDEENVNNLEPCDLVAEVKVNCQPIKEVNL